MAYSSRAYFEACRDKWKEETQFLSDTSLIENNENLLNIVKMGELALPFIFQELKTKPDWWFSALIRITGQNPMKLEHAGNLDLITQDWLKWIQQTDFKID